MLRIRRIRLATRRREQEAFDGALARFNQCEEPEDYEAVWREIIDMAAAGNLPACKFMIDQVESDPIT